MKIGILGGTGLIGSELIPYGIKHGHHFRVFTRRTELPVDLNQFEEIELITTTIPSTAQLEGLDAVINLVGEPIAGVRWTLERKNLIRTSRVDFTRGLVARIRDCKNPPKVFIQGSAIGYYGMSSLRHVPYDEAQIPGTDFLSNICVDWEREILSLMEKGIRTIILRTGIVLSTKGGALEKMIPPFQFGLGGPISSGEQGMSWIHITDFVSALFFLLTKKTSDGPYNIVSPHPCSNEEFSRELAKTLFRPCIFKIPAIAIQALYGEGAQVITEGQYVTSKRLQEEGYEFQFQNLGQALRNLLLKN
jgi:uncharacterized protein (TIGR01777 family)